MARAYISFKPFLNNMVTTICYNLIVRGHKLKSLIPNPQLSSLLIDAF